MNDALFVVCSLRLSELKPVQLRQLVRGLCVGRIKADRRHERLRRCAENLVHLRPRRGELGLQRPERPLHLDGFVARESPLEGRDVIGELLRADTSDLEAVDELPTLFDLVDGHPRAPVKVFDTGEVSFEVLNHLAATRVAVLALLREAAQRDLFERLRDVVFRGARARRRDRHGQHSGQRLPKVLASERRHIRQDFVEESPQRVDVRSRVHLIDAPRGLLRRHVRGRPRDDAHHRGVFRLAAQRRDLCLGRDVFSAPQDLGDTPVQHERLAEVTDHHVRRLDVSVDDPAAVREANRHAHLLEDPEEARAGELFDRPVSARELFGLTQALDDVFESASPDDLHREEDFAPREEADLVHRHDVWVLELPGDLRLLDELLEDVVRDGVPLDERLHDDRPHQIAVADDIDTPDAAPRELRAELVSFGCLRRPERVRPESHRAGHEVAVLRVRPTLAAALGVQPLARPRRVTACCAPVDAPRAHLRLLCVADQPLYERAVSRGRETLTEPRERLGVDAACPHCAPDPLWEIVRHGARTVRPARCSTQASVVSERAFRPRPRTR